MFSSTVSYLTVLVLALTWSLSHQQRPFVPGGGITNCDYELDVVFAIDGSNSMFQNNFNTEKAALANLVNSLNVSPRDIHVGVVLYSSVAVSYPLNGNKQDVITNINNLQYPDEMTRTDIAITTAHQILNKGRGGSVRKLLIIITDGRSTAPAKTLAAAQNAKQAGITIITVGVTNAIKESELRQIASTPQSMFYSQNFQDLNQVLTSATNQACITIPPTPTPGPRGLDCTDQLDIIIAIDSSNSLFINNFQIEKAAIGNLISNLAVSPNGIHIGLVLFSGKVQSHALSGNVNQITRNLNAFQYLDDSTRTDLAIQEASSLFRNARGGSVRKVLIIVTDGRASFPNQALQAAQTAKNSGILIFALGVSDAINQQELQALASAPQQVLFVNDFRTLEQDLMQVAYQVCNTVTITTPLTVPTACNFQLDLIIAIDGSNSMYEYNFNVQKAAIANLVRNLNIGASDIWVGLVLFSGDIQSNPLSQNKQEMINVVNAFQYPDDATRTDLAIQEAQRLFSRARGGNVPKLLIVVTDGRATYPQRTLEAAQEAKNSGISISAVGVTEAINQAELQAMASTPQQVFHSADFQSLQRDVIRAANEACQYVTTPLPPITIRTICNDQLDLVIAMDGSNSMLEKNFNVEKSAVVTLIQNLNVSPKDIHVGLILFSGDVTYKPLNGDKSQVIRDMNAFPYPDDATRTDLAIERATNMFRNARGGNVQKLLMIVTDGRATYPQRTLQAAQQAKSVGITIYALGVTDAINQQELRSLASTPQHVFFTNSFQTLRQDLIDATRKACYNINIIG